MKRVLVLATTFPRWQGDTTRTFVYDLENRLTSGFDISVLAPHHADAQKHQVMGNLDVHRYQYFWPASLQQLCYEGGIVPALHSHKWLYLQAFTLILSQLLAAIRIIKKNKISLIHAHWVFPQGMVAFIIKKIFGIPYMITSHGSDVYGLQNPIFTYIKKIVFSHADAITAVSSDMKTKINQLSPCPVKVLPMGVDSDMFHPKNYHQQIKDDLNISGPFLLFVGRLIAGKGVTYLIQAMPSIISSHPLTKLVIIGDGPESNLLKKLAQELNLQNHITFLGSLPHHQLPSYYATADIFISPPIITKDSAEGFGLTLVEAAFSGSVPVGTDVGGITDILQHNQTGFIVSQKDPVSIVNTVNTLLSDPNQLKQLKTNIRQQLINKFDWQIIARQYLQIYTRLTTKI